jgi:hypothetical protein
MSDQTTIVLIVVAVVVVVAVLVLATMAALRRRHLKEQFGPEYDRLVESEGGRRAAESELRERERRHDSLDLQPLDPAARDSYAAQWARVQEQFVDDPRAAVSEAGRLLTAVMADRGYPADEDDEQRMADLSVEHGRTLQRYRSAYAISRRADEDGTSTEELRHAMVDYRALFQELLVVDEDVPARDTDRSTDRDRAEWSEAAERDDETSEDFGHDNRIDVADRETTSESDRDAEARTDNESRRA